MKYLLPCKAVLVRFGNASHKFACGTLRREGNLLTYDLLHPVETDPTGRPSILALKAAVDDSRAKHAGPVMGHVSVDGAQAARVVVTHFDGAQLRLVLWGPERGGWYADPIDLPLELPVAPC